MLFIDTQMAAQQRLNAYKMKNHFEQKEHPPLSISTLFQVLIVHKMNAAVELLYLLGVEDVLPLLLVT